MVYRNYLGETPAYTVINWEARKKLGLTILQYCVADSIRILAEGNKKHPGWCEAGNEHLAEHIGCTKKSISMALNVLEKKKLIERVDKGRNNRGHKIRWVKTTVEFNRASQIKEKA